MTIGELKQNLSSYSDDIPCAYMLWMPEDVFDKAKERGIDITNNQVNRVLSNVYRKADTDIGITWDVISLWIDEVIDETN